MPWPAPAIAEPIAPAAIVSIVVGTAPGACGLPPPTAGAGAPIAPTASIGNDPAGHAHAHVQAADPLAPGAASPEMPGAAALAPAAEPPLTLTVTVEEAPAAAAGAPPLAVTVMVDENRELLREGVDAVPALPAPVLTVIVDGVLAGAAPAATMPWPPAVAVCPVAARVAEVKPVVREEA